ncbi:alpha-2-macroglobulin family protein [Oleiharenicola lentus]|uniref:alpha-2-macroglobulin family protein n=1 Tax=Oleiharenicola lentus TaxID=2508720 RepID=UPI003F67230D
MKLRLCTLLSCLYITQLVAGSRDAQWKKVDEAVAQKLPQTAITELEAIAASALADGQHAEATKAIARRIVLAGGIQGDKAEERIVRLEAEIVKAPAALKPVMESLLAHWYWNYFQQNRWRFLQRTQGAAGAGSDLKTWDLPRILAEIDRHFTAALADEATLRKTPVADLDALLERGNVPDTYRPTLYDFLVHEALRFYQAGEQGAVQTEDAFVLTADSPIFSPATEFLQWKPATTDDSSPLLKAIALYQQLLRIHQKDTDRSAYLDADLARLSFGFNSAVGEEKAARYKTALEAFIKRAAKHELSAHATALLAQQLHIEGESTKAHDLARRANKAFPETAGGARCFNLVQEIEAKSARVDTEFVWNAPWPTLDVTYRNVTKIYFRAFAISFEDTLKEAHRNYRYLDQEAATRLLATKPALAWNADLPATADFKERTESLAAPTTLKPGYYAIIASHRADFSETVNQLSATPVWVSNLALVIQSRHDGKPGSGFILQADRGEPISGASIRVWTQDRNGRYNSGATLKSDAQGRFPFPSVSGQLVLLAEHNGHAVSTSQPIYTFYNQNQREREERVQKRTLFFTDRALYRPGQIISYKGISFRLDQKGQNYATLAREKADVVFLDANGREVARTSHVTNDYGSFSGTFTAPRAGLSGNMSLKVENGPEGYTSFNVEEYKRPKFEVEIPAPASAAKLDQPVTLTGKANAYTGSAIGGAKVKWRVERAVQLPRWCWWWQPPATKAIAHGTALTEDDGTFKIEFTATADQSVSRKTEPVFRYTIHADVTDLTGETRSAERTVAAGYTALQASLGTAEWQTPDRDVEFAVTTQSLDGAPQTASGTLTIHALKQPTKVTRQPLRPLYRGLQPRGGEPSVDPTNPDSWELGSAVTSVPFTTDASGSAKPSVRLKAGIYRASLQTKDRFGQPVTSQHTVEVIDASNPRYSVKKAELFAIKSPSVEPGEKITALWGTGYDSGRAFVELECDGKVLQSYWTDSKRTQQLIELPITERMRGGVTLRTTFIRENRAYLNNHVIDVPWSNKDLSVKWESFRSKILPGQKETWTATIEGHDTTRSVAEMVATLYDASLDQFRTHDFWARFDGFRSEAFQINPIFQNQLVSLDPYQLTWQPESLAVNWEYRHFPEGLAAPGSDDRIVLEAFSVSAAPGRGYLGAASMVGARNAKVALPSAETFEANDADTPALAGRLPSLEKPNLDQVTARKNLNETAFFFPHLLADKEGRVKLQFTMPEALTRWKFLGFAHDKNLRAGLLTGETVTAKDVMVQPNPPRFVREGDAIEFTVKVSNQTDQPQTGQVRLTFADAATLAAVDNALANLKTEQAFDVPAKQSRTYSWRIAVPDGMGFLTYKAVGATATASDGEEGFLPVLSRRILVTESLPLPIRGPATQEFDFTKLRESASSDTLRHQSLTVQMVSQPAWYAVLALPYLMEFPHECSEQLFSRLYANALARHVANSDPKIRRIFDLWKNTPALDSPLTKNEDLKSVLLEETPWLRQATRESESRRRVGLLFDANRLDEESARILQQLAERQLPDGLWAWFPGGRSNEYISLTITTGLGRLRHLGVELDLSAAIKSLAGLDAWMQGRYREIQKSKEPEKYVPGNLDALYLYGRSFFLKDQPIAPEHQPAVDFFLAQSRKFWTQLDSRQSEAHLALALQRFGDRTTPQAIVKSLRERSQHSAEFGMFWRDAQPSWWWYHAPIETQAVMIEVFAEVARDAQAAEDCKVWLLKQKQTQDWKTTKATADATYALLLQGKNLLSSDALVEVSLGGTPVKPQNIEPGTGFYEQKFIRDEIKPEMGRVTVKKIDQGVSWGSAHWQYLEDIAKVTPHEGTPLTLKKALFVKRTTKQGPVLTPVSGPVEVGDELVVRLELRTDRDMEYVHLKDQRGSGTEPVNVLSGYRYQDGLGYYESTRDTASHFFIDYLRAGTYVFEYSTRIQLKGRYQSGIAEIQCMYAPEFNSHSGSIAIEVK